MVTNINLLEIWWNPGEGFGLFEFLWNEVFYFTSLGLYVTDKMLHLITASSIVSSLLFFSDSSLISLPPGLYTPDVLSFFHLLKLDINHLSPPCLCK